MVSGYPNKLQNVRPFIDDSLHLKSKILIQDNIEISYDN